MARANRHFLSGYVWHITHRCHKKEFLLKLVKDRQRFLYWLFEAKKQMGSDKHTILTIKCQMGSDQAHDFKLLYTQLILALTWKKQPLKGPFYYQNSHFKNVVLIFYRFMLEKLCSRWLEQIDTGVFFMYADGWPNPNNCTRSDAVVLQATDLNYDKSYALLLAAYISGKKVSGYSIVGGCVEYDGQTYNMIRGYKYLFVE